MSRRLLAAATATAIGLGGPALAGSITSANAAAAGPALSVDVSAGRHDIDPDVYGMNFADPKLAHELRLTVDRWGGNSTSTYNFRNDTFNLADDYFWENVRPQVSLNTQVGRDLANHTQPLVTVPMLGWVSKDSPKQHPYDCSYKVSNYGKQQYTDGYDPNCGNGVTPSGKPIADTDLGATYVKEGSAFDGEMVRHFVSKFGSASHGGVKNYELDNEPGLWNSTHRDIFPKGITYNDLWSVSKATAMAVKQADSSATVDGPGDWGWCSYFFSPADPNGCSEGRDRKSHGNLPMAAWYLKQFAELQRQTGKRMLDYFDEHYYPQASGVSLQPAGDASTQALRLRSTQSLWNPKYTDESWTKDLGLGPVMLIPRMRAWVDKYYPGTKLSISEYNWGGLESINGALAEADVLGIFGREGVSRALLWSPPASSEPGAFAFRIYRNYDGHGHGFGDVGVKATSADQGKLAVYAAQRSSDHATTIVVINKTGSPLSSRMSVTGASGVTAKVYSYSSQNLHHIVAGPNAGIVGGQLSHTYPASSITLFVIGG